MVGPLSRTLDVDDPEVQRAMAQRIPLIINRARAAQAQTVVRTLGGLARRFLGSQVDLVGSVRDDPAARRSIQQMRPLLETGAHEGAAADLQRLISLLIGDGERAAAEPAAIDSQIGFARPILLT